LAVVVGRDPRAAREAVPVAAWLAQIGGHAFARALRTDGWNRPCLLRAPQRAGVGGDEDVGRAVLALARMRAISWSALPSMRLIRMPVSRVKRS
jgi:hypothetical protein